MAGYDNGDRIRAVRRANSAKSLRLADPTGKLGVAPRLAIGNLEKRIPDLLLEGRPAEVQRQLEFAPLCVEILLDLAGRLAEQRAGVALPCPNASCAGHFSQKLQGGLDEGEAADPPVGGG